MIRHLAHEYIGGAWWDQQLAMAPNRVPYARAWYLDLVCPGWGILLDEARGYFMPVPEKHTLGVRRILQPPYCQQLGIFGQQIPDSFVCDEFLSHGSLRVIQLHIALNASNHLLKRTKGLYFRPDNLLSLDKPYSELSSGFDENTHRNIRKAMKAGLEIRKSGEPGFLLQLKWKARPSGMQEKHLQLAGKIMHKALERNEGEIWYAFAPDNEPLAGCFFLKDDLRSVYLISASSPEGKETGAMFLLVSRFIETYAGTGRLLDFEGSTVPGIARFFKGFGAATTVYPLVSRCLFGWLTYGQK
jgi:hypothetical protein